ncbi:MAG: AAC(3) family N-acetyltransferase [Cellulosilyticum sp.]|nr:AAC(3) family N-acetyltransferase [Cellulosilyticum sp.]
MYTKQNLKQDLEMMGLLSTDTIMIHSSMKSIGNVEGGADTVIDALMEYFSEGLLMTPAHTWAQMSETYSVFDPIREPACVGIIPNLFLKRTGVVRSLHPTHSIAAFGKAAVSYIQGEENCTTPCTPGGCWDRLREIEAKILLVGVTHIRNTFIHSVEEVYEVPERLTAMPTSFQIKMPEGGLKEVKMHRHYNPYTAHISEAYDKLEQAFYDTGAAKKGHFGDAECILCDAKAIFEITGRILERELNCLIDREEIPQEWWSNHIS